MDGRLYGCLIPARNRCLPPMAGLPLSLRLLTTGPSATRAVAAISDVVELLLRRAEGGDQRRDEELRRLLTAAPYTPSHLLQVIRSLPGTDLALWFFHWCRSQDSASVPAAAALHGPSAYQAMFEIAAGEGGRSPCDRMKDLLDRSMEEGHALTLDSAALLVQTFSRAGMLGDVLRVLRHLKPSLRRTGICNGVLRLLFAAGDSDSDRRREAINLASSMIRNTNPRCGPDSATASIIYSALLTRNSAIDDKSVAQAIEIAEQGLFPADDAQFSQIINTLCRSRRTDAAWDFLHAVKRAGGPVGAPACNSLLSGLAREEAFCRMDMLFAEMEEMGTHRNPITFGILINNLCKSRRIDDALKLLDDMIRGSSQPAAVMPDVVIFNTVIDGLCKAGRMAESAALMNRMKRELACSPNTVTYNSLVDGFCKAGEIERALDLLEQMKDEGVPPSVVTLNTLIDGMCRQGRISSALEFFRKLQLDEDVVVKGNAVTYSILIGAFLHSGNLNKAEELYEEMLRGGLRPDATTYFTMISGLTQAGKPDEASCVASTMEEDGFSPDTKSYNILIAGFCHRKRLDRARDLIDEMARKGLKPDEVTFNTLIAALSKAADFASAQLLMNKMTQNGHKPSVITYGALIHGYCRAGDMAAAADVLKAMDAAGVAPNAVIFNILIDFLTRRKEPEAAVSLMEEMQSRGLLPTTTTYNALFRSLKESNMLAEALALMDRMKEQNLSPDYVTMEILSGWLPAVGEATKLKTFLRQADPPG